MLTLTRKTEYALIAVCHLASEGDRVVSARDLAEQHGMPLPLLMNVLKRLNRTGYVTSVRGARGGYVLAIPPEQLTLDALIAAVEGPVHLVRCVNTSREARRCTLTRPCPLRGSVRKVHERFREFLASVTMADLVFDPPTAPLEAPKALAQ